MENNPIMRSAVNWLGYWANIGPDETALVIEGDGRFTFGQLAASVAAMARWLAEAGMQPGALVGIESDDQHRHIVALLAAEALGACTVSFSAGEVRSGDAVVGRCDWVLSEAAPAAGAGRGQCVRLDAAFAATLAAMTVGPEDLARLSVAHDPHALCRLSRSSGTSGDRKIFGHSIAQLDSHCRCRERFYKTRSRSRAFIALYRLPLSVVYMLLLESLYNGSALCMVTIGNFDRVVADLTEFHVSVVLAQLPLLIDKYQTGFEHAPVRWLNVIGGEVPAPLWAQLYPLRFGHAANAYTTSEMKAFAFGTNGEAYTLADDAEARIVDAEGQKVAEGQSGLIEMRSPRMPREYLWAPELTEKHFVDGWFRTFDVGQMPKPGQLVVGGRGDDLINIGSIKIMPDLYEARLRAIPGVKEAVVIGIPDQNQMVQLHAVLEGEGLVLDAALSAAIRAAMAGTAVDCWTHVVPALPRTETGKVRRGELRQVFATA